jgi:DNA-binding SARP family transcriptional activator/TolB-like protein
MSSKRTPTLNVSLFGRFEVIGPDGPVVLTSKKLAGLLAYLASTHPTPHSREKLMTLLWGGHGEANARQNLRQALSSLRHLLGKDVFVSSGDTISLQLQAISCDVLRFEMLVRQGSRQALSEALELYKDRFLADLKLAEEGWSEWLSREQQRLEDIALNAIVRLGEEELASGNAARAIVLAKRGIAIDALREDAYRLFMRAAAVSGRKAEALQQYDLLVDLLKRELDVEPDGATSQLAAQIRARSETVAPAAKAASALSIDELVRVHAEWEQTSKAVLALDDAASGDASPNKGNLQNAGAQLVDLFNARIVDRAGNKLLLEFPDPRLAVRAAHAMRPHGLRMSAHASASWEAARDTATRLLSLSSPGHLTVSDEVRDTLTEGLDAEVEDLGEHNIGIAGEPVRAYRAAPPEAAASEEARIAGPRILPAIAVVPFSVSSIESNKAVIGQLLAHEIIARLSQAREFDVISRMSTRAFCGRSARLSDIAAWLRADYALWGNCDVRGDRLSIQFELANARSETVIWAGSQVVPLSAVQEGYADIVGHIAAETCASVLVHELARTQSRPLETLENYSLLMAAINLIHRTAPGGFTRARKALELLAERLPHHPLPQAWMAQWHVMKVGQGWADDVAAEGRLALDCARRASDSDPSCSIAIAMDGWVHTHLLKRFDIAAERLELAVEVNPNDSIAWLFKGTLHSFLGQGEEAVQAAERALRLSPLDPRRSYYDCLAASAYCAANSFERAIELGKRSLRVNRLHSSTLRSLTCSLALSGRVDEARQMAAELMKLEPNLTVSGYLARHPAASFWTGKAWAEALRLAGVPA